MATDVSDDRIGGYRIVRTLLRGQTSDVMEVEQVSSGRRFALKQLREAKGSDPAERKLFAFEAKLGMDLHHPNLIRVHEHVPDKTQPYFVMDFFPSMQLRPMIVLPDKYPVPPGHFHRILEQAARGLAYMHDKGWVHRDVKPENILVNKAGEVRVIDYALAMRPPSGLGKLFGGKPPCQGTPSYISPEQIRREPPAFSADIYSFGVTCYEIACGRQPFRANSPSELFQKHLREKPLAPVVHNKKVTPEFSDLVLSMIQKNPKLRPESLHEFLSKFRRVRIFQDDPIPESGDGGYGG